MGKKNKEEEQYVITPKGIACFAMLESGLIGEIMDKRVDDFWNRFTAGMMKHGYTKKDNDLKKKRE